MTLIVGWVSVDKPERENGISALYFASDSCLSWKVGDAVRYKYHYGKKLFTATRSPEIFGFCGDVLFPSQTLSNLIDLINIGVFFSSVVDAHNKSITVLDFICKTKSAYPEFQDSLCTIYYGTKVDTSFSLFKYSVNKDVTMEEIELPNVSTKVFADGSGKDDFESNWVAVNTETINEHQTSRAVYHCLSTTIEKTELEDVGGAPQMVGLYRGLDTPRIYGIIKNEKRYINGILYAGPKESMKNIEWRNDNFEIVDPHTMKLKKGAQAQPFK